MKRKQVWGIVCIVLIGMAGRSFAQATGFFSVNVQATITAQPEDNNPDTVYVFATDAQGNARFSLPVTSQTGTSRSVTEERDRYVTVFKNRLIFNDHDISTIEVHLFSASGKLIKRARPDKNTRSITVSHDQSGMWLGLVYANGQRVDSFTLLRIDSRLSLVRRGNETGIMDARRSAAAESKRYVVKIIPENPGYWSVDDTITVYEGYNDTLRYTLEDTGADSATGNFQQLLSPELYEQLFPNRYGLGRANPLSDGDFDFYSYQSLLDAIDQIADIEVLVCHREGVTYCQKVIWRNRKTNETRTMISHPDYNEEWNLTKPETCDTVNYGSFCAEGDPDTRKRELAAFLANISHETTGMGSADESKTWGLYWREEVAWQTGSSTDIGYAVDHAIYPPWPGKSYHGRGPIQLSYNYNYGQVSEFLYGDKTVLLERPELLLQGDATRAFMTAIWFWMTPQNPKPSCHDVMVGNWEPTAEDREAGRDQSTFGMTVNIINGGLECNTGSPDDYRVLDRIGFYQRYASIMDVEIEAMNNCHTMQSY